MEDTSQQLYLKAMQKMKEDDFSKYLIKPLFESMGFYRVDFYGGPYESGKDLIAFVEVPVNKTLSYAIQSKKIGEESNTSEKAILGELVFQLRQCFTNSIKLHNGEEIIPDQVYLASPYQISIRLIDEIHGMLKIDGKKIEVLDGPLVINLLKKYKPTLLEKLLSVDDIFSTQDTSQLCNIELMSALNQKDSIHKLDCYSDLAFFMGTIDSNVLINSRFTIKSERFYVTQSKWEWFERTVYKPLKSLTTIEPLMQDAASVLRKYNNELSVFTSKQNREIKSGINQANQLLAGNISFIREVISELDTSINNINTYKLENANLGIMINSVTFLKECLETNFQEKIINDFTSFVSASKLQEIAKVNARSLLPKIVECFKKVKASQLQSIEIRKLKDEYKEEPKIEYEFNSELINSWLSERCKKYKFDIQAINSGNNSIDIFRFLNDTQTTLNVLDILVNKLEDSEKVFSKEILMDSMGLIDGLSTSPFRLFDCQHDIAVYGSAGAGKTTTLQMYARKLELEGNRGYIYLPLNRFLNKVDMNIESKSKNYDILMSMILISKSLEPVRENIEKLEIHLRSKKRNKIILDGLDEAYVKFPGIIEAINFFKSKFDNIQLIISSRDCVSYLSEINFLGITLMPFSEPQLYSFIQAWFKDKNQALSEVMIDNIKAKKISDIIRTPLLATLLCDLAEKGIDIPSSESEIFTKRLELLCGSYDTFKDIKRTRLSQSILIKASHKIAFAMHSKTLRAATKQELVSFLVRDSSFNYEESTCSLAVAELIDPCNILIFDPISETFSFGHLRYQEHLASLELMQNRSIEIIHYLKNDWWRGALCLYAQCCEFSILLEEFTLKYTNIKPALITLREMVKFRPEKERRHLNELVNNYEHSDDDYFNASSEWDDSWSADTY
ncbi:NACHT domain-containing protein [Klebsiella sp. R390]|uniref:NACHT domain-containing protein n=1 Tax=Klebsiella sp. R390 TaxID=2755400 RepID=UPI003DA7C4F6